jgi:ankyrin repeat protein
MRLASWFGHLEVARFLIEKSTAVSAPDKEGDTPFHIAEYQGHLHVMKFLPECGVDVDIWNGDGRNGRHCTQYLGTGSHRSSSMYRYSS